MSKMFCAETTENTTTQRVPYSKPVCIVSVFDLNQNLMLGPSNLTLTRGGETELGYEGPEEP